MNDNPKLKLAEITLGKKVVVSRVDDAQVYDVTKIHGVDVFLTYMSGQRIYSGGWIDYSVCREPTEAQLAAA